jgi:hypothetical protein
MIGAIFNAEIKRRPWYRGRMCLEQYWYSSAVQPPLLVH